MIDPILKLKLFTRDLLGWAEDRIKSGRTNFDRLDSSVDIVVVDSLTDNVASIEKYYDNVNEKEKTIERTSGQYTLNFYGDDALGSAHLWVAMTRTQAALELQEKYGITVYASRSITNLRELAGSKYRDRQEVTATVQYNIVNESAVLRIETAQFNVLHNK